MKKKTRSVSKANGNRTEIVITSASQASLRLQSETRKKILGILYEGSGSWTWKWTRIGRGTDGKRKECMWKRRSSDIEWRE